MIVIFMILLMMTFWSNDGIDYISMYKYRRGLNCMGFPDLIRSLKRLLLGSLGILRMERCFI